MVANTFPKKLHNYIFYLLVVKILNRYIFISAKLKLVTDTLYKYIANSKIVLVNLCFMKSQHQVILSIGSNQGNRLENVRHCIELIHQKLVL
jgi:hypothetical protein